MSACTGDRAERLKDGSTAHLHIGPLMLPLECQCTCGSNSVCRQVKAHPCDVCHPPHMLSVLFFCDFCEGPREQVGVCEGPTAAECNQAQLLHTRGHEHNAKGGGQAVEVEQAIVVASLSDNTLVNPWAPALFSVKMWQLRTMDEEEDEAEVRVMMTWSFLSPLMLVFEDQTRIWRMQTN